MGAGSSTDPMGIRRYAPAPPAAAAARKRHSAASDRESSPPPPQPPPPSMLPLGTSMTPTLSGEGHLPSFADGCPDKVLDGIYREVDAARERAQRQRSSARQANTPAARAVNDAPSAQDFGWHDNPLASEAPFGFTEAPQHAEEVLRPRPLEGGWRVRDNPTSGPAPAVSRGSGDERFAAQLPRPLPPRVAAATPPRTGAQPPMARPPTARSPAWAAGREDPSPVSTSGNFITTSTPPAGPRALVGRARPPPGAPPSSSSGVRPRSAGHGMLQRQRPGSLESRPPNMAAGTLNTSLEGDEAAQQQPAAQVAPSGPPITTSGAGGGGQYRGSSRPRSAGHGAAGRQRRPVPAWMMGGGAGGAAGTETTATASSSTSSPHVVSGSGSSGTTAAAAAAISYHPTAAPVGDDDDDEFAV